MTIRWIIIASWFLIASGCSSVQVPKERIVRSESTYGSDLTQLQQYLGDMPVDVVVAGYRPQTEKTLLVLYSPDSAEATIRKASMTQLDPEYTYLRSQADAVGNTIRITTKHVTRISANGIHARTIEKRSDYSYIVPIVLGILAIGSAYYETTMSTAASGCKGGCLALAIVLGAAAVIALGAILLLNNRSSIPSQTVTEHEVIVKTWILQ